ncbi:MAG: signal peptidase I [Leptolyngbyaceae cyanobacterium]
MSVNAAPRHREMSGADPWLAVNYALIWPGLGQLYSRHWVKGSSLVAIALGLLIYAVWSIFAAHGNTVLGFWAIAALILLYSFNILDAYRGTQPGYAARITVPKGRLDPWYAVFLSQILPGLGHLYTQQVAIGGGLLIVSIVTAWLASQVPLLVPLPPAIWAFSCYHLYATFPHRTRRQSGAIAALILGLFLMRLVLGHAPHWVHQSFIQGIVPSDSMTPTLQVGDRLFVRRDQPYQPQVGDVIVFEPPSAVAQRSAAATSTLFVKRLIGLPGQQIAVAQGQILVDGQVLVEPYQPSPPTYQLGPERVPPDSYFVLGDNRDTSDDSHIWGYLPAENLLGKAYKIYWPPERIRPLE